MGVREALKAWLAGPFAGLTYLSGVWVGSDASLGEALAALTAFEWVGFALAVGAGYGVTWAAPNRDPLP